MLHCSMFHDLCSCVSFKYFNKSYAKLSYSNAVDNWVDERVKNGNKNC